MCKYNDYYQSINELYKNIIIELHFYSPSVFLLEHFSNFNWNTLVTFLRSELNKSC